MNKQATPLTPVIGNTIIDKADVLRLISPLAFRLWQLMTSHRDVTGWSHFRVAHYDKDGRVVRGIAYKLNIQADIRDEHPEARLPLDQKLWPVSLRQIKAAEQELCKVGLISWQQDHARSTKWAGERFGHYVYGKVNEQKLGRPAQITVPFAVAKALDKLKASGMVRRRARRVIQALDFAALSIGLACAPLQQPVITQENAQVSDSQHIDGPQTLAVNIDALCVNEPAPNEGESAATSSGLRLSETALDSTQESTNGVSAKALTRSAEDGSRSLQVSCSDLRSVSSAEDGGRTKPVSLMQQLRNIKADIAARMRFETKRSSRLRKEDIRMIGKPKIEIDVLRAARLHSAKNSYSEEEHNQHLDVLEALEIQRILARDLPTPLRCAIDIDEEKALADARAIIPILPSNSEREMHTPFAKAPPLLPANLSDLDCARWLLNAYRGCYELFHKKQTFILMRGDIRKAKDYKPLVDCAHMLRTHEIEPARWAVFMFELWVHGNQNNLRKNTAVPLRWVFDTKRLENEAIRKWYEREAGSYFSNRLVLPLTEHAAFMQKYQNMRGMAQKLENDLARNGRLTAGALAQENAAFMCAWYPEGYVAAMARVRDAGIAGQKLCDRMRANGEWIWGC